VQQSATSLFATDTCAPCALAADEWLDAAIAAGRRTEDMPRGDARQRADAAGATKKIKSGKGR
jgi:hypothetical protein